MHRLTRNRAAAWRAFWTQTLRRARRTLNFQERQARLAGLLSVAYRRGTGADADPAVAERCAAWLLHNPAEAQRMLCECNAEARRILLEGRPARRGLGLEAGGNP